MPSTDEVGRAVRTVRLTGREVVTLRLVEIAAVHAGEALGMAGYRPTSEEFDAVSEGFARGVTALVALLTDEDILAARPGELEAEARDLAGRAIEAVLGRPPEAN